MSELFPELDDESPMAPTPRAASALAPAPSAPANPANGVHVRAPIALPVRDGRVAALETLLGLPGPFASRGGCRIESAEVTDDGNTVTVTVRTRAGSGVIRISGDRDAPAFVRIANMSLSHLGPTAEPAWLIALIRHAAVRLADTRYEAVRDAASSVAAVSEEERSIAFGYASSASWRTFFEVREQYRSYCGDHASDAIWVHHADLECQASLAATGDGAVTFFNHLPSIPRTEARVGVAAVTDVRDVDVIKGGDARLERVLVEAAKHAEKHRAVMLTSTCISLVTGDDIEGAAERMRKRVRIPVLNLSNVNNPAAEAFRLAQRQPGFFDVPHCAGSVNLVGLPRTPGRDDLIALLASAGVRVNCLLLPDLDAAQLGRYMSAELQVLYPCAWQAESYPGVLEGIPMPSLTAPPPYGVEGTRRWFGTILEALGRVDAFEAAWESAWAPHRAAWEALTREARSYHVGFVVDDELIDRLREPEKLLGVPLVPLLREMGFGVELLIYGERPPAAPDTGPDGARRAWFTTRAQLAELIATSRAAAFYSDVYFDQRLTRSGKGIVSLRDVSLGAAGAVATLRRLLETCRLPFYRTYGRYLGAAFRGVQPRGEGARGENTSHDER